MNRRHFLGAMAASCPFAAGLPIRRPARLERIGLELYSVRAAMTRDPDGTLSAVRSTGYSYVELLWSFDNFGRTLPQVRAALRRLGLRAPSAHIAPEMLLTNWQQHLDDARFTGHEYLIVPSLPAASTRTLDGWRSWADRFNTAGEQARKAGVWLAFHNEPDHQRALQGAIPYDVFIERTDPRFVRLQLDTGNMLLGGGDPHAYLAAHRDRYWSFHLKDATADRRGDTELGRGTFDFGKFLAAIPDLQRKPCYVEQEAAADPLRSAAEDLAFLRRLRF